MTTTGAGTPQTPPAPAPQIVLVLQGGGALGAYQAGVYQALAESGVEPDWVIGTSIGAINGALIAGNRSEHRLARLGEFWRRVGARPALDLGWPAALLGQAVTPLRTMMQGIPGFFRPNPGASWSLHHGVGVERAAYYSAEPLRETLAALVDFDWLDIGATRLTVGAVGVRDGEMRYFDSRERRLGAEHIMASGALPPAFPAVRIDGEAYWDGGICSNTPIEVVLDDKPRRDALIFSVNVWPPQGDEPDSLWQVLGRHKDIQYASRDRSHVVRQQQIHRLRHVIRELERRLGDAERAEPATRELAAYGCSTVMHLVRLLAPRLDREDHTKDIDFSRAGIAARSAAGYADARRVLRERPWEGAADPLQGVIVHEEQAV